MHVAACHDCGAPLPPPDRGGRATCVVCRAHHSGLVAAPPSDALASSPAGDGARIAMNDEAVLGLLREHFTGLASMYLCPTIPGKRELAARAVHARRLPSHERVLALFDDTVFGSGDEGFVVTSERICWKNPSGRPHMVEWHQVDPDRMYADRRKLVLGPNAIELSADETVALACEAAFHVLAFSARAPAPAARSGIVLSALDQHLDALEAEAQADADAQAANGNAGTRASDRPTFRPSNRPSAPPPVESEVVPRSDPKPAIANATPPPPHAVTYASYVVHASSQKSPKFACWHCHTPLHWNTPQCSHCNAYPMPQGWLRTG